MRGTKKMVIVYMNKTLIFCLEVKLVFQFKTTLKYISTSDMCLELHNENVNSTPFLHVRKLRKKRKEKKISC